MTPTICLCSDLDRTILPNGFQAESPGVRNVLRKVTKHPGMTLVYVTGRNHSLVIDAIDEFDIPVPDYVIGDKLAVELMKIRPNIPVILCTGYSKKISDDSVTAIAYKPIVKADLAKMVRKVLDEAKGSTCD
jgi:hypothetical protein